MHECAAGRGCRGATVNIDTRAREPATIEEPYGLCPNCIRGVRIAMRDLAKDYGALGAAVGERAVRGQLAVSLTPDPAIPVNATVLALQFELAQWAEAALLLVAQALNIDVVLRQKLRGYPVRNAPVIGQACKVFPHNVSLLLEAKAKPVRVWQGDSHWETEELDGVEVALKMVRAHSRVKGLLGEDNPRKRLTLPCPMDECGMPTLGINNGETDVTCTSCGGRWSEPEIDWLTGMLIGSTSEKEIAMLRWFLAEKTWELTQLELKLTKLDKLANLPEVQEDTVAGSQVAKLMREILSG